MNTFEERRRAAALTQEAVAKALNIDRSTVAKWETGKALPTTKTLISAARLYGCTVDELLREEEKPA
ncbi:MAG: helix-turn-helix transcriptional regulator [Clostridia bacterium]|nr:helix-turn-helix transcriptional regulator [Clostridia bacterium]